MEYSQHAANMISIAASIGGAIVGLLRILIVAPWCNVFHHCTEK